MSAEEAEERRHELLEGWEQAATGWGNLADRVRAFGMPVSSWMIEHLELAPGQRVLELAAGPGDTGFLAAELIKPGGTLVCSDGAEAMLELARERAAAQGIDNVEFKRLELEWIDLPAASVDALLCRWGIMLTLDPDAALREARRVLRPGGRAALAVWDDAKRNPWATVPGRALVELGHSSPPDPTAPGPFALGDAARLRELIEGAGFVDVVIDAVDLPREYPGIDEYLEETLELSRVFADAYNPLPEDERQEVRRAIAAGFQPFTRDDGSIVLPGRTLVVSAGA